MPIYLEEVTAPDLPAAVMDAILRIGDAAVDRVITPGIAVELLRTHLLPVLPRQAASAFALKGQPRWDSLQVLYADLLSLSGGLDVALVAGAHVVDLVWRHSTRPARISRHEHTVDVASFLRMAAYAKLAVPTLVRMPSGMAVEPLRFCKYCWRSPRSAANVCPTHAVHRNSEASAAALYKHAQRLRPTFERNVLGIATREELAFHDSEFTGHVFVPREDVGAWLAERRPMLHRAAATGGAKALRDLIGYLFGGDELMSLYLDQPHLLTVVTLRAEAWLQAEEEKGKWGGRRDGAGRKRRG